MTPIKQGKYEFKKQSLIDVRNSIGINQRKMAELLGVPANTLSRWEIGDTTPDAKHLAAFYSVAKEHGITPSFFGIQDNVKPFQYNLIVIWDFQTTGTTVSWVQYEHKVIMTELQKRFSGMTPLMKAFTHPTQKEASIELEKLGWRLIEDENKVYDYIIEDARSDSGHNPEGTVLVLISKDDGFLDLIDELTNKGVKVYIMSTHFNNKLLDKVGQSYIIPWYPVALEQSKRDIKNSPNVPWSIS